MMLAGARASIMTGRYHVNTGMNYVLAVASPGGLDPSIPTIPSLLKSQGHYSTAMAGKWHLGHAQHKMTPIGHGFDSFTGSYMWDVDSYSKQLYEVPWHPLMIDWIAEHANGTFRHYAEPLHATVAITVAAQDAIREHVSQGLCCHTKRPREILKHIDDDPASPLSALTDEDEERPPLFLYVPYTAAHSPLQPLPEHEAKCMHIKHHWRRGFCGMVVGMDEGIRNITETALDLLGTNTIVVVTSDNGGSPWFGGMNAPLRGSKSTPYEGGVRVPALIVDFTAEQRYLGLHPKPISTPINTTQQRVYHGLMHSSDWLPTLLSYAGVSEEGQPEGMDGLDFSQVLRRVPYQPLPTHSSLHNRLPGAEYDLHGTSRSAPPLLKEVVESPRKELLVEMYFSDDFIFGEELQSFILGDFKYVK
eukprot:gene38086-47000_t